MPEDFDPGGADRACRLSEFCLPTAAESVGSPVVPGQTGFPGSRDHDDDPVSVGRGPRERARGQERFVVWVGVERDDGEPVLRHRQTTHLLRAERTSWTGPIMCESLVHST
jgi:hypothetical protein